MRPEAPTVLVAMSGGVDSSVAAGLLLEQGFRVVGVTLLMRPQQSHQAVTWCCASGAVESAQAACHALGIRHEVLDYTDAFAATVLQPAWREYRAGRTPNPCVHCNVHVKFAALYQHLQSANARYLATGHYAEVVHGDAPRLCRAAFAPKDQTYFLFGLGRDVLNATLFPLARLSKDDVRALAQKWGLPTAQRPDSQDACFVDADGHFSEALRHWFDDAPIPGPICDPDGRVLGEHRGIHRYTVGQRKGLGVATGQRAYVSRIDAHTHTITLTIDETDLRSAALLTDDAHWISGSAPTFPLACKAQIRYRSAPVDAVVTAQDHGLHVAFSRAQKAVTPGQAVVFYRGDCVLGGAWISRALP
ncbi:MAG: tRNA 2-thiouridine(34) synthase MnmA [Proteobacteria bacterium]|nr:tRNA 2-thiouridine(34) synthase MnmA [Pseudomonadota bacterium]